MIGKEGSYLVTRDRKNVEKQLHAKLAASHKLSAEAETEGESELSRVQRPLDVPLPDGAGKSACRAAELLVHGNQEFRMGSYVSAIDDYSKGVVACATATGECDLEPMKAAMLLNRAACLLHNESREENLGQSYSNKALQDCDTVLQRDPCCAAALTRRALAFEAMELFEEAEEALAAAIAQRPEDEPLAAMLPTLREKAAAAAAEEAEGEIDWAKFGLPSGDLAPSSGTRDDAGEEESGAGAAAASAQPEESLAASLGVATDPEGEPEPEQGLAAQLTHLSDARPALRVRDYDKAAEAMIPKEPEELEDDEDAWTARAYGEADFSAQEEEEKKKKSELNNLKKKGEGEDDDEEGDGEGDSDDEAAPPLDSDGERDASQSFRPTSNAKIEVLDDDDDGMPGLENPDAATG
jgi:tetratricopeptide (TPR) repeat protein